MNLRPGKGEESSSCAHWPGPTGVSYRRGGKTWAQGLESENPSDPTQPRGFHLSTSGAQHVPLGWISSERCPIQTLSLHCRARPGTARRTSGALRGDAPADGAESHHQKGKGSVGGGGTFWKRDPSLRFGHGDVQNNGRMREPAGDRCEI